MKGSHEGPDGEQAMRRTIICGLLAVVLVFLFITGLEFMTTLRERGWSDDPETWKRQALFVIAVGSTLLLGYELNRLLNPPRDAGRAGRADAPRDPDGLL